MDPRSSLERINISLLLIWTTSRLLKITTIRFHSFQKRCRRWETLCLGSSSPPSYIRQNE